YPEYQLFESTVYKDIAFGIRSEGLSHEEEYRRVLDAAEKTGLSEDLLENSIYDLSGGQKRRAAIAGIIVMNPKILVLDEPAAGLDPAGRDDILQFAKRLRDDNGITVILVSHSMEDIAKLADKVIVLNEGKLEMMGTPREVFRNEQRLNQIGLTV
ncbi:MAG TPA: energy-coupling factor ABC transporter ATP-binding protein, partial [Clostridiales bacterium]|nr:energy-coupling factor ABC transporter ATP-binding protein [Clostridiales bacterium]